MLEPSHEAFFKPALRRRCWKITLAFKLPEWLQGK